MPRGLYARLDPYDETVAAFERFSCAPGPAGWRYTSQVLAADAVTVHGSVDVTVDSLWRPIRMEVRAGGWMVRGGASGREVLWVRSGADGENAVEHAAEAAGFTGRSPGFLVALLRLADLEVGERVRLRLVEITEPACLAMPVERGLTLGEVTSHEAETESLRVERYELADLASGERFAVHLAGDLVLDAPHLELRDLETPPNQ